MSVNTTVRLRTIRVAVLLASLLSLLCLVVPNEAWPPGTGRYLGAGKAAAADVTPVTVDNSTSDAAVMAPTQRKLFHAAGRFWVFYTDGADLVYKSSPDGLSWSDRSASLGALSRGDGLSVYYDGTYVHYARSTAANDDPLYWRRGIPGADGTVSWSSGEQVAVPVVSGVRYMYPSVSVDSSGHALISYHYEKQSGLAGEGPCITKSGNTDGTWGTTPAGFPHLLAAASESEWYTSVHGLSAGRMAVAFADHTDVKGVSVATYDGANWNSTVTTVSNPQFGSGYSAVAEGDDVHIALLTTATYDLLYCKYTYATNTFGSEYALVTAATGSSFPSLARDSNNDLYCFWPGAPAAGHIYYMRMLSGVWDTGYTDWVTETNLAANGGVSAFYEQDGADCIGVAWEAGAASPYDVRFAAVDTAPAPNQPPNQPGNVLPADMASGQSLAPTLQSSGFSDPDAADSHAASQWQITAVSGEYSDTVFDSEADNANLLSIVVPSGKLDYSITYYWRVRHQDNHGDWSAWSDETSFSTMSAPNQPPNQPGNVLPADVASGQSLTPTLESSGFSDPDNGDIHGASQWQIRAASGSYSIPMYDSLTDSVNLVSIVVLAGRLSHSVTYYWRVRYQDNHGDWSAWSAETCFTTASLPNQPPNRPGNASPSNGAGGESLTPTLASSAFSDPDGGDAHDASQWQITAVAGDYSSPAFDSQADTSNLLSIAVPADRLAYSTTYCWHVRHQDNHGEWSEWSTETSFVTAAAPVAPPEEPDDDAVPVAPITPPAELGDDALPSVPGTPSEELDNEASPAAPVAPPEELHDTDNASASPDADGGRGMLPFLLAIGSGVAAVAMVGGGLFLAHGIHVRLAKKPKGLSSARTISQRLRK